MVSDARRFLISVSTRLAVLKIDSEVTVDAGGVNKSRVIIESTRYVDSCDFHHVKKSKISNSKSASISGVIARVK